MVPRKSRATSRSRAVRQPPSGPGTRVDHLPPLRPLRDKVQGFSCGGAWCKPVGTASPCPRDRRGRRRTGSSASAWWSPGTTTGSELARSPARPPARGSPSWTAIPGAAPDPGEGEAIGRWARRPRRPRRTGYRCRTLPVQACWSTWPAGVPGRAGNACHGDDREKCDQPGALLTVAAFPQLLSPRASARRSRSLSTCSNLMSKSSAPPVKPATARTRPPSRRPRVSRAGRVS